MWNSRLPQVGACDLPDDGGDRVGIPARRLELTHFLAVRALIPAAVAALAEGKAALLMLSTSSARRTGVRLALLWRFIRFSFGSVAVWRLHGPAKRPDEQPGDLPRAGNNLSGQHS